MQHYLKHTLASVALAVLGLGSTAQAAVVAVGTTYDFTIFGTSSGLGTTTLTFDGAPQTFSYSTTDNNGNSSTFNVTVNESQSDLGNGQHQILFNLSSLGELYPVTGETATVAVGASGDVLDLLQAVRLDTAYVRFYADAELTAFQDVATFVLPQGNGAFNGAFVDMGVAGGLINFGGRGTYGVQIELNVSDIPEPHTAALAGIALLGVFATRRRQSR